MDILSDSTNCRPRPRTTIDNLPNEIIHQICLYLDCESIKNFSITCPRFFNIVANSSAITKKFKLKLTSEFWKSEDEVMGLERKYNTIEMVDVSVDCHNVVSKVFEKFGPHLRKLSIHRSTVDDFTLLTILRLSWFLEELVISEVAIELKLPKINPISIVHLRSISIHKTNWLIFKFLSRSQITSLLVNNSSDEGKGTRCHLVSMLYNQYRLQELTLLGTSSSTLFRYSDFIGSWNNRLIKCHITSETSNKTLTDKNIGEFLCSNNESLTNVHISIAYCTPIIESIIFNLHNVTSLVLDVGAFQDDNSLFQKVLDSKPNFRLKHLKLCGLFVQPELIKAILTKFPSIENLELDDWSNTPSKNILKFVVEKCPYLQQLFIPAISRIDCELKFSALKQLHIVYIQMNGMKDLVRFIEQNSSLDTLKIGLVHIGQVKSICKLMDRTNLQHLSFAGNRKNLEIIIDFIRHNTPKQLKTLELSLRSLGVRMSFSKTLHRSMQINFPLNPLAPSDLRRKLDAFFNYSKLSKIPYSSVGLFS
ncbi:uncharacterized protein LOC119073501 [Bradysia coprophila]|uniref:uncharacterized protein LOC119073501 n=1 Tax=Bradysia coprophila TaxID=38358 RepID=UPI00187DD9A0|nr:uncharacterized protein LOC119073501 [Bradysia coprophila]